MSGTITSGIFLAPRPHWRERLVIPSHLWINGLPIWLGLGVLICLFSAEALPYWLLGLMFAGYMLARRSMRLSPLMMQCCAITLCIAIGGAMGAYHLLHLDAELLTRSYRFAMITAKVTKVTPADGTSRLVLSQIDGDALDRADRGKQIRLTSRSAEQAALRAGDVIRTKATLFPPSRPSYPGGFDFRRYFLLRNISAVGYTVGDIEVLSRAQPGTYALWLADLRQDIQHGVLAQMDQPQAGVAIALTTGEKSAITPEVAEAMRISGLAHMLAISGMHMAIMCSGIYVAVRFLLACIPYIALRWPIRHYAALLALISGACYLALADFPISAIRAYAMIALYFTAILVGREADALRSLVLAALGMILIHPAVVTEIGFQLSFTAVLALILTFRRFQRVHHRLREYRASRILCFWPLMYLIELMISSLVAGLATAPLMLLHFNQFSPYGLVANMLALPVLSVVIAPIFVLSCIALPLSLSVYPLFVAEQGLALVIAVAQMVASWEGARVTLPGVHPFAVLMSLTAMVGVLCSKRLNHACGYLLLAVAPLLISTMLHQPPHILIAEDRSAIAVALSEGRWLMLKGTARNFHHEQWQTQTDGTFITLKEAKRSGLDLPWHCDKAGCDGIVAGKHVRVRFDYKAEGPLCLEDTDILLSTFYSDRWDCASEYAVRIDRSLLERHGSHALTVREDGQMELWHSCKHRKDWPWMHCGS